MKKHEIQLKRFHWSKLIAFVLVFTIALGGSSCKSKKKIVAEKAAIELANKIAQAKASLIDLLRDDNPKTYEEKVAELKRIKDMQLRNPDVEHFTNQAEAKLNNEYKEILQKKKEEKKQKELEVLRLKKQADLDNINAHFISIAEAANASEANLRIKQTLTYYASPEIPVLLIINIYGDNQKDYDKPTTIGHYLNYLKDVKTYNRQIESIKFDENHKIIEIELIKK